MPYDYPVKFGKYLLTKRIAVGGMAELFLAKMVGIKGFEKILALKKILPEFGEDEEFVELFVDEAKISVQLQHANIVQVFDFGEIDGSHYIAQEFVDGPNLKNFLKRCLKKKQYFPFEISVFVILQIIKALEYAQRVEIAGKPLNLVHRDVSPQNVLISREGEVKITDFGIAKATIKASKTQPGKIQGKFSYMSPEQATGSHLDHRSDIFSLGIIFFEMLTGYKLYSGDDTSAKYARVREAKIPKPTRYNPNIPKELEEIVLKMLAKDPDDRFQSAGEIQRELTDYLYPSSTELIAESLKNLVTELFPTPMSQEREIKVGKILEIEKESSTRTDFKLIAKDKDKDKLQSEIKPVLIEKKKTSTRESIQVKRKIGFTNILKRTAAILFLLVIVLLIFYHDPDGDKNGQKPTPTATLTVKTPEPTPSQTAPNTPTETPAPTPTETATAEPTPEPTKKPVVIKPTRTPNPCPFDMSYVKKSVFLFGSKPDDPQRNFGEEIQKRITIDAFCIDNYEYPNVLGKEPRTEVDFLEAKNLCEAAGKQICTEKQWEKACRGKKSQKFPYGDLYDPDICNTEDSKGKNRTLKPIGSFEKCKSSYGASDMSGNISEWVLGDPDVGPAEKGGSYLSPAYQSRCAFRRALKSDTKLKTMGFRCCKKVKRGR